MIILFGCNIKDAYTWKGKTLDMLKRHKEARAAFLAASKAMSANPPIEERSSWMYKEPFRYDL
jgi:hypothetical protein